MTNTTKLGLQLYIGSMWSTCCLCRTQTAHYSWRSTVTWQLLSCTSGVWVDYNAVDPWAQLIWTRQAYNRTRTLIIPFPWKTGRVLVTLRKILSYFSLQIQNDPQLLIKITQQLRNTTPPPMILSACPPASPPPLCRCMPASLFYGSV